MNVGGESVGCQLKIRDAMLHSQIDGEAFNGQELSNCFATRLNVVSCPNY